MTEPVRWGILGTGWVAQMFCDDLKLHDIPLAAVGSRSAESAQAFAARYDIARAHAGYAELVHDPDVDIVYVASPHPFHAEHAELAIRAGKHVMVEKPFTINAAEAQRIVDLAAAAGVVVLEAMWSRYLPHIAWIDEVIAAGTIGELRSLAVDHTQKLSAEPQHRVNNPDLGGGALLDLGIYPVWFADHLFGAAETVRASVRWNDETGVDRADALVLDHPGARQASIQCACDVQGPNRAAIIGSDGWIELDQVWYNPTVVTVRDTAGQVVQRFDRPVVGRGMQYQAWAAAKAVRGEDVDLLSGARSVQVMRTMDAIRREIELSYPMESAPGVPA